MNGVIRGFSYSALQTVRVRCSFRNDGYVLSYVSGSLGFRLA